jgi:hypothetical protein
VARNIGVVVVAGHGEMDVRPPTLPIVLAHFSVPARFETISELGRDAA